jgi:multisubunit Na+/H+ antiporter MnhF subunit
VSVAAAIGGVALFVWTIRAAGGSVVLDGIRRLGAGFAIVWLMGAVRYFVRSVAWSLCVEDGHRLPLAPAFAASVAGDSIGNITPFGFFASEPSKIVFLGDRVDMQASIGALALENLFYSASVVVMLVAGTAALLLSFEVPHSVRVASLSVLGGSLVATVAATWIVLARVRLLSRVFQRARSIEDRVFALTSVHPERLAPIAVLEALYHAAAVFEIWYAVALITGHAPTLLTAFVLEYVNRTITVLFQFVPMWIGVDEAGTGLLTAVLRLGPATGVSLALVRKARILAWTVIGLALAFARSLRARRSVVST